MQSLRRRYYIDSVIRSVCVNTDDLGYSGNEMGHTVFEQGFGIGSSLHCLFWEDWVNAVISASVAVEIKRCGSWQRYVSVVTCTERISFRRGLFQRWESVLRDGGRRLCQWRWVRCCRNGCMCDRVWEGSEEPRWRRLLTISKDFGEWMNLSEQETIDG